MNYKISLRKVIKLSAIFLALSPLIYYGWRASLRPAKTELKKTLFKGITYQRKINSAPRPHVVHIVEIDLTASGIKPFVTPPKTASVLNNNPALTTSSFIDKFDLQLAVNGSFFYPFHENTPWDYYPKSGQPVNVLGQSISNSIEYGNAESKWNVLCFSQSNKAQISTQKKCPLGTVWGVGGRGILVIDGKSEVNNDTPNYARTIAATNNRGDKLWLIVVDGKQPLYSQGATLKEVAEIAIALGADRALNLDGGGSTTLAVNSGHEVAHGDRGVKLLNAPIHTRIPMRERPVANHLGFYALPITQAEN